MDSSMARSRDAMSLSKLAWYGLLLVPLLFLGIFFLYPLAAIFEYSLFQDGQFDFSGFTKIVSSSYYLNTLAFTTFQAILSTILTLALALPSAYVFTRYRFQGKSLLLSLATLPFVLPTVVVAAAFVALLGESGLVNDWLNNLGFASIELEGTLAIILIVHVFYNYALALRMIQGYWANQSSHIEEAARVLGASGWRLWWYIRLPLLSPAILAAAILVFIFTFTSFGVVLILGGLQFATLEVQIYYQARNIFNLPLAAALSLVQIVSMMLMMFLYTSLQRQIQPSELGRSEDNTIIPQTIQQKALVTTNLLIMLILLFVPLAALGLRSFMRDGVFTLDYYALLNENPRGSVLFVPPLASIGNSLLVAVVTTLAASVLGILTAYLIAGRNRPQWLSRFLDPLFMLPLATSAVTLGFGFTIALDTPPLDLRSSLWMIPIAHTLVAIPFVVRSVLPTLRAIPPNLLEAGAVLGASPLKRWLFIELPLLSRGVIVGATFAFTVSMGEFGASLFVARPDMPTIPIVIFRLLGQPGANNYGQAIAMSSLLMGVCALSFILIERLRKAGLGEF
jgi:thiamine transport system permease protein